jgi:hypothetical protein
MMIDANELIYKGDFLYRPMLPWEQYCIIKGRRVILTPGQHVW